MTWNINTTYNNKNHILVTGAVGFIASHLVSKLLTSRFKDPETNGDTSGCDNLVIGIDNLSTGKIENVRPYLSDLNFNLIIDTVCNYKIMEELIKDSQMVYHLAAPVGVKKIMNEPVQTVLNNTRGTDTVLELCNKYRVPVFVASTSEVYGKTMDNVGVVSYSLREESDRTMGNTKTHRWAYANTKAFDEMLAFAYYKEYGLPMVIGRFFNIVGPGQVSDFGMVVPTFVKAALKNEPLYVYGDGKQSRCFMNVLDCVDCVIKLMADQKTYGDVYNIGNNEEISIEALARLIICKTNSKSEIRYMEYIDAYGDGFEDMTRRVPNIDKLKSVINVNEFRNLDKTLDDVISYWSLKI